MKPGVDPWASWLATLSSAAQAQITGVTRPATVGDDDQQAFTAWEASLTEEARVALRGPAVAVAATPPPKDLRLGLVELHDGQLPVLRVYSSAAALARRLQALQDQDLLGPPLVLAGLLQVLGQVRQPEPGGDVAGLQAHQIEELMAGLPRVAAAEGLARFLKREQS
jgi:hypothetical protein